MNRKYFCCWIITIIGLDTIKFAKERGIVMLSFPPHCSHKLQPLDRSVFGPFKRYVSTIQDTWMRNNPANTMSIYDLPRIARDAWPKAATQANITNGFKVSGIHPLQSGVFNDMDFAPAYVTDRPDPYTKSSVCGDANTEHVDTANSPRREESQPENTNVQGRTETELQTSDDIMNTPFTTINSQLRDINREIAIVPGDGHCLLHAVAVGLAEEGIDVVTIESLCTMLVAEVTNHADHYRQFSNSRNVIEDIDRYVRFKEYNTDTADLILSALCNCLGISAIIYNHTASGVTNVLATGPGRSNVVFKGDIYLVLTGANGNAHYNGVKKITTNSHAVLTDPLVDTTYTTFCPERIRPFPKAAPRKNTGGRKKRKSAVLTDTPEKNAIEEAYRLKQNISNSKKSVKRSLSSKVQKKKCLKKKTKRSKASTEVVSSDEDEWFCLICVEPYSNSRAREAWIQCQGCKGWSHEECTNVRKNNVYICHNCESDGEADCL